MTRLILVRHGESDWNRVRRIQGQLDRPLTPRGRAQARAVGRALAEEDLEAVYASDLARAVDSARLMRPQRKPILLPALRERHFGAFQGLSYQEAAARHPAAFAAFRRRDPDATPPEDGESLRSLATRCLGTLEELSHRHRNGTILVVTHGECCQTILRRILGIPDTRERRFTLANGAINRFHRSAGAWELDCWGRTDHLHAVGWSELDERPVVLEVTPEPRVRTGTST